MPTDFSGEMAAIQQQLARCHDMVVRRGVVLGALAAAPGERILELGCGACCPRGTRMRRTRTCQLRDLARLAGRASGETGR